VFDIQADEASAVQSFTRPESVTTAA